MSEDPSSFSGGDSNLYRYAEGDPVNHVDPTGLAARMLGNLAGSIGSGVGSLAASMNYASAFSSVGSVPNGIGANSASQSVGRSATLLQQPIANSPPVFSMPLTEAHGRQIRAQEESRRFYNSLSPGTTVFSDDNSYEYRLRQIERVSQQSGPFAVLNAFRTEASASLNRFLVGEARNPGLETPNQKAANDAAEFFGNAGMLALNAFSVAKIPANGLNSAARSLRPNYAAANARLNTVAPSSTVRTNAQLVQDVATRADAWATRQGLTGTPQRIGIAEHGYAQRLLNRYQDIFGQRGLQTEITVINGSVKPYGTAGAVRLDVLEGAVRTPTTIYDYKFGTSGLSPGRINQLQNVGGYQGVPVIEVRP